MHSIYDISRAGATELALRLKHDATPEQLGVSRNRIRAIAGVIRTLGNEPPELLHYTNGKGEDCGDPDARRTVRFLCALAPDHIADDNLAAFVYWLLGSRDTRFSVELIRHVLNCKKEAPGHVIRDVGRRLRRGESRRAIKKATGAHESVISKVTAFLGTMEARAQALPDHAIAHVEAGGSVTDFAKGYNISKVDAEAALDEAAFVLDLDPDEIPA